MQTELTEDAGVVCAVPHGFFLRTATIYKPRAPDMIHTSMITAKPIK